MQSFYGLIFKTLFSTTCINQSKFMIFSPDTIKKKCIICTPFDPLIFLYNAYNFVELPKQTIKSGF